MTVCVLWLFLKVSWVGLQCVILVFPGHIHLVLHDENEQVDLNAQKQACFNIYIANDCQKIRNKCKCLR